MRKLLLLICLLGLMVRCLNLILPDSESDLSDLRFCLDPDMEIIQR